MTPRSFTVGVMLVSVLAAGAGCGSSSADNSTKTAATAAGSSAPASAGTMVQVKDFAFTPQKITVPVGTTVTWKFEDSAQHTATAVDKSFNSPKLNNGQTFQWTFSKAGTFDYFCSIHQFMTGTVTVTP